MKRLWSLFFAACVLALCMAGCDGQAVLKDYTAAEVLAAIKAAYGADYLPNAQIEEGALQETFGLDLSLVEEAIGEMPALGARPDRVVVVKAKEGQGAAVEQMLLEAREKMLAPGMFYPASMPKVSASQVLRQGDYVCFLMLGAIDEESQDEEAAIAFAHAESQKGADAFFALFQ